MRDLLEALAVLIGGFGVLALVLALVAATWWLVGIGVCWVWGLTIGSPPMVGWQFGLLLFTVHLLFKILFVSKSK